MKLIKCTRIPGHPKHRIETCWDRKEKAKVLSKKEASSAWKHGAATGDFFYDQCFNCDPTEMRTVEFDTRGITAPILQKKFKKRAVKPKIQESKKEGEMKKEVFVCKECKEKVEDATKFIVEKGVCRKCYMKDYYKRHPKKTGSKLAPKKSRQGEDVVEKMLASVEAVTPKGKVLETPVKDLTLRNVVEAGGEVRIVEKKDATKDWRFEGECGTELFNKAVAETEKSGKTLRDIRREMEEFEKETPRYRLVLDFTGHKDLLEFLEKMAREDFRSPGMEILALLDEMKDRGGKNAE